MRSTTLSVVASLLALTTAVPLEKRVLVVETVTDVVVKTLDLTTTVWVKPTVPTNAAHLAQHKHHHAHNHPAQAPTSSPAPAPAPVSSPAPAPAPIAAHPQSQPEAQQIPKVAKQPEPAPVPAPAPVPTEKAAPVAQQAAKAAAPAPQPAAPARQEDSFSSPDANSGSTADCGKVGMPCSGDITFYDTGLGACGWTNDGTAENVFALAHGMMGEQSNGNPFCGRSAEIELDGKKAVGKLVDKCGGCEGQSIDLSHKLFQALAPESMGRISGVKWHFID
ncbi:MAG: hypothetical protein Q9181_000286 [Wetmoreana brouardii]